MVGVILIALSVLMIALFDEQFISGILGAIGILMLMIQESAKNAEIDEKNRLSSEERFQMFQDAKKRMERTPQEVKFECSNCGAPLRAEFAECDYCGMRSKPKNELPSEDDIKYV